MMLGIVLGPPTTDDTNMKPPPLFNRTMFLPAFSLAGTMLVFGCASYQPAPFSQPFPESAKQSETLDIQVIRDGTTISFTNTTARTLPATIMWLNRRFCRPVDALEVGETRTLALSGFKDEFGQPFRAGGFFASEAPDKLVQAQLESVDAQGAKTLLGLVVIAE